MRSHDSGRTLLMVLLFIFGKTFFLQSTGVITFQGNPKVFLDYVGLWMGWGEGGEFIQKLKFCIKRLCVNPTKILLVAFRETLSFGQKSNIADARVT